jgi:acylphosphatase
MKSVILNIYGVVQNVGFRYYTHKKANELGVKGFVRNMPDGSVYAEAEADPSALESFIAYCRRGPDWARVSEVKIQDAPPKNFTNFTIK